MTFPRFNKDLIYMSSWIYVVYKHLKVLYVEMEAEFKTYFYFTIENIKQSSLHVPSKFQPRVYS